MKYISRHLFPVAAIALAILLLYIGSYILFDELVDRQIQAFSSQQQNAFTRHYGYIQPQVLDGFTEEPIEGAVVVIPETGQQFITSDDGQTATIKIPVMEDQHFAGFAPKPWSEVTLIVYKEGYLEYVLFHTHVWENQTRKGPRILLFPKTEGQDDEPFSIVESPHRIWVKDLVDKFRPNK